jgi:hypothetical protein
MIEEALATNPETRLILEIADRARRSESKEAPKYLSPINDVATVSTNSQCLVPPVMQS